MDGHHCISRIRRRVVDFIRYLNLGPPRDGKSGEILVLPGVIRGPHVFNCQMEPPVRDGMIITSAASSNHVD